MVDMQITPDQIRAARALKGWSQGELATRTGLAVPTIANIEIGKQEPGVKTMEKIIQAFEANGIEFIGDSGVQKRQRDVQTYHGTEGFIAFLNELYDVAKKQGGSIYLFNARPDNWDKWLGRFWYDIHAPRMTAIQAKFDYKILSKEGDTNFISDNFAEYRWMPETLFDEKSAFYVYGDKVGVIDFQEDTVSITTIDQKQFSRTMRILFENAWENLAIEPSKNKKAGK